MTPFFKSCKYTKVSVCHLTMKALLTNVDYTGEGIEREPRLEECQLQHYWRGSSVPGSVDVHEYV
jgi:hypothetical protein